MDGVHGVDAGVWTNGADVGVTPVPAMQFPQARSRMEDHGMTRMVHGGSIIVWHGLMDDGGWRMEDGGGMMG